MSIGLGLEFMIRIWDRAHGGLGFWPHGLGLGLGTLDVMRVDMLPGDVCMHGCQVWGAW